MQHGVKRYRQASIKESFAFHKKQKSSPMEEARSDKVTLDDSIVKKSSSEDNVNLKESKTIGETSKGSTTPGKEICDDDVKSSKSVIDQLWSIESTTPGEKICDDDVKSSKSVIDQLWGIEDVEVKNKSHQTASENPVSKSEINQSFDDDEGSYRSSADLFPEKSSLDDDPVPSSSGSQELFDSPELFPSQSPTKRMEIDDYSSESDESDSTVTLNRSPDCDMPLPKLEPSENHFIMFSPHIRPGVAPRPFPKEYKDKWDTDHVRMPCSPLNKYPIENSAGETSIISRWDLICQSLLSDIQSSEDLENAIMTYNSQNIGKWDFLGLHYFMNKHWREEERDHFFENLLPAMIEMALNLPSICTQAVPLLKKDKDRYLTLSQKQIGCLLLNAFFCTFPRRNPRDKRKSKSEYSSYPDINFNRLFAGTKQGIPRKNAEKLKCLFNYFRRITSEEPCGTVTFHRQVIKPQHFPNWYCCDRGIRTAVIKSHGLIENEGKGLLQVDFANKFVGGGVLGQGCVQEEIRFVACPDLIVSRLFVERLENNEALIVTGVEEYNKYSGYADTFKWEGDSRDNTPRDSWGRCCTKIVAMDATHFRAVSYQYGFQNFKRELNKAYSGFYEKAPPNHLSAVATGNWGCGAFKGSPYMKFIIQLMAASECGRSLLYFTFHNKKLKKELQDMYDFLNGKNLTIGHLWRLITDYSNKYNFSDTTAKHKSLYAFIYSQFTIKKAPRQQESSDCKELTDSCKTAAQLLFEELAKEGSQKSEDIT